jgi:hypothetical protein
MINDSQRRNASAQHIAFERLLLRPQQRDDDARLAWQLVDGNVGV